MNVKKMCFFKFAFVSIIKISASYTNGRKKDFKSFVSYKKKFHKLKSFIAMPKINIYLQNTVKSNYGKEANMGISNKAVYLILPRKV